LTYSSPISFVIPTLPAIGEFTKDKTLTISDEGLLYWWAHQDLNLGPKDYESSALAN
jgi:hypothetical protein